VPPAGPRMCSCRKRVGLFHTVLLISYDQYICFSTQVLLKFSTQVYSCRTSFTHTAIVSSRVLFLFFFFLLSTNLALSNGPIPKLNFLVSGRISVVMSTISRFWLSLRALRQRILRGRGSKPVVVICITINPLTNKSICSILRFFAIRSIRSICSNYQIDFFEILKMRI